MNSKNYYIVAKAPDDPSLKVKISGPYFTQKAAKADLAQAISEAQTLDSSAKTYDYEISYLESQKPGILQHMAASSQWEKDITLIYLINKRLISKICVYIFEISVCLFRGLIVSLEPLFPCNKGF